MLALSVCMSVRQEISFRSFISSLPQQNVMKLIHNPYYNKIHITFDFDGVIYTILGLCALTNKKKILNFSFPFSYLSLPDTKIKTYTK